MFICGASGTGKSNFLQNFLLNFTRKLDIPFLLVEFKGEYNFLQQKIDNTLILMPGINFSVNIFDPINVNPLIHAERVFDILKSGRFFDDNSEYTLQMERVLIEILTQTSKNVKYQNWEGYNYVCNHYLDKHKDEIPMLNQTLIAIKNGIRRYSNGPLKRIFSEKSCFDFPNYSKRNLILDISSIIRLGGEKEHALFFLNMLLKYLWDKNLTKGAFKYEGIKHLTIIEDSQYFAPRNHNKKNRLTSYLEDIALLLRGTGECFITLATGPNISYEILANTGVVVCFKNNIEKEIMCEILNLESENKNYISYLHTGLCIIRCSSIEKPFILKVPKIERTYPKISEIYKKNTEILE